MKIVKWLFAVPIILIVLGFVGTEINKAYWDSKVREMCEKDGGVTVFEKVEISKDDYPDIRVTSKNLLILPPERKAKSGDPLFYRYNLHYIRQGFLNVVRHEQSIIRSQDGKLLSKHISYGRQGGDFPTGLHPSHFSCGRDEVNLKLLKSVITVKGE